MKPVFSSIPGLILALVVALAARQAHWLLPNSVASAISPVLLAVLLGLLLGNVRRLPASFESGIRFAYQSLLRWAIVLLGASLSLETVLSIGG
ncbi:MAG TPA: putative sulfate exporter family transporter, partial [Candidatus Krumholzibacteria bacterium]